jgi:hypothetical protein
VETKEEKLKRLRFEREQKNIRKNILNKEFYFDEIGNLCRKTEYGEDLKKLYVDMPVRVVKPDGNYRNGVIDSIKIEDKIPIIVVVCGQNKIKFEKNWFQVYPDNRLDEIKVWEGIEVPEKIKNLSTPRLLREYRLCRRQLESVYKKELYLREHVGSTNKVAQKKIRQRKAIEKNGKRNK